MNNDKLLATAFLGIISTIPAEILTQILVVLKFGKFSIYQLASLLITFNRPTLLMGFFIDAIVGGFFAFIFYYVFAKLGSNYILIKVTFASLLAWLVCELAFTFYIEGRFFDLRPINDYYNHMLGALVYGIILGLLFNKYIFKKTAS